MKSLGKTVGLILVLSLAFLLAFGIDSGAAEKEIKFGYLVANVHDPFAKIMKEKKYLEAEGLKVKWGEYLAGAPLMQHFASGEVDFGILGIPPTMIARAQGVDVVVLASTNSEGSGIVVSPSIKQIKDLDGKMVGTPGIGSIQDAMLVIFAKQHNIKVKHRPIKVSDMALFLQKGEIDGFIAWEPFPTSAVEAGYGHMIALSRDILPGHQCCVFVARGEMIKKDPDTVRKVLRAYMKAFDFNKTNHPEVVALEEKYTGMSKDVLIKAIRNVKFPDPPFLHVPSVREQAEGLISSGKIQKDSVKDVDKFISDFYNPSFLKEYLVSISKGK
jgi:NitT/TauT family transport system substrate-binding protein